MASAPASEIVLPQSVSTAVTFVDSPVPGATPTGAAIASRPSVSFWSMQWEHQYAPNMRPPFAVIARDTSSARAAYALSAPSPLTYNSTCA